MKMEETAWAKVEFGNSGHGQIMMAIQRGPEET